MLCSVCEEFLRKPPNVRHDALSPVQHLSFEAERNTHVSTAAASQEGGFLYHSTLRALQINAVQQKCHLCTLVWSRLQRNFSADVLGPDKVTKALQDGSYVSGMCPQVRICVRQVKNSDSYIHLCVDVAMKGHPQGLRDFLPILTNFTALLKDVGKQLGPSTSDDACIVVATQWLDTCIMQHEDCCPHRDFPTIVPARLLDVSDRDDTGLITLHETRTPKKYEYFTLSHCWGKSSRLRLTNGLLSQFLAGIAIDRLAQTFQDAIKITQRLGYHYIWIDCLCIMQDSPEDWATESAKMAGIYGNGVCNIAAAASSDSDGGCFSQRNPFEIQALRLQYDDSKGVHKSFREPVCIFGDNVECTWDEVGGPLDERGWILQEIALAPRTLYYGKNQLYWECRSARGCEVWPTGDQTYGNIWSDTGLTEKLVFDIEHLRDEEDDNGWSEADINLLYCRWESLVERYSTKLLTYGSDKLIALSGLADMFVSRTGGRYLAGLWEGDLLHGLVWSVAPNKDVCRPGSIHPSFRAPTWSWASIDGAIQYPVRKPGGLEACAEVLHVDILPVGKSQTGHILGANVQIRGPMKTATWVPAPPHGHYGMQLVCPGYPHDRDLLMRLYPDTEHDALETTVHCLQLCRQSRGPSQRVFGLVLVPTGVRDGEYRRIGSFQTPGSHYPDDQVLEDEDWTAFEEGWSEQVLTIN
jgi:hypothetical protein